MERATECVERGKWWSGESYIMCREREVVEWRELHNVLRGGSGGVQRATECVERGKWWSAESYRMCASVILGRKQHHLCVTTDASGSVHTFSLYTLV